jgi:hypothetical protein
MTGDFVPVILAALKGLEGRTQLRASSDDLSTFLLGPPEALFKALEDVFVDAAASGVHVVMNATFSRGCPGEPDEPCCHPQEKAPSAVASVWDGITRGVDVSAQFALLPLGDQDYMSHIVAEIDEARKAGVYAAPKHFCSKLKGDAHQLFSYLENAFDRGGAKTAHTVMTATLSVNSPVNAKEQFDERD